MSLNVYMADHLIAHIGMGESTGVHIGFCYKNKSVEEDLRK